MVAPLTDAQHANAIRKALSVLEGVLREAAADGVSVQLKIGIGHGWQRGADRSTTFPTCLADIARPL